MKRRTAVPAMLALTVFPATLLALDACTGDYGKVKGTAVQGGVPKRAHVIVADFAADPDMVQLETGRRGKVIGLAAGETPATAKSDAARATQAALAEELAAQLAAYGLPVRKAAPGVKPPPDTVVVRGVIHSVNQSARTHMTMMGFGGGPLSVDAEAQLFRIGEGGGATFLRSFTATGSVAADENAAPGTIAAAISLDRQNAKQVADKLAEAIRRYAEAQGWIASGMT